MKTKDITLIALLISILIICSQITIPIGPVPITLQTFTVVLIGMVAKPRHSFYTTLVYLIIGLIGFPIFAGGLGGFQALLSPSFGFAIGFIPASYLQSFYLEKSHSINNKKYIISTLINYGITYLFGLAYMAFILNIYLNNALSFYQILLIGMVPFIPGDLLKNTIAITLATRLRPQLKIV